MSVTRRIAVALVIALTAAFVVPVQQALEAAPAAALSGSDFDPGYIISDEEFFDSDSMTVEEIQAFLEDVSVACSPGYYCADTVVMPRATTPRAADRYCDGYASRTGETVAKIVFKVAESCGINPKVLLVMLQKEQGLFRYATTLSDAMVSTYKYKAAMGYACPDTAACDEKYYGFDNQVYNAARQLQVYTQNPTWWNYRVGANKVYYHPDSWVVSPPKCGTMDVTIQNQATANLYIYTPYTPNAAALSNLRGTGDSCSSYGNRNFWVFYNDWFGSPTGRDPEGRINSTTVEPGVVNMIGWALDEDTADPIDIHVYIDGDYKISVPADVERPDIGAAFPRLGPDHGFELALKLAPASREICLRAVNTEQDESVLLGCRSVVPMSGDPTGAIESAEQTPDGFRVEGWAVDPDSAGSATVGLLLNGSVIAQATTDSSRTDIDGLHPAYVESRGFSTTVASVPRGNRELCMRVENVGYGADATVECRIVRLLDASPDGRIDSAVATAGGVSLRGWAIDSSTLDPIDLHVYVDGVHVQSGTANTLREDVGAAYPAYGDNHGFELFVPTAAGAREVCVYGIDVGAGRNRLLACRDVVVRSGSPDGRLGSNVELQDGQITVSGWAIDFDTVDPILIHIYRNGVMQSSVLADLSRPDVGQVFPGYGDAHGFTATVPAAEGTTEICAYGIDVGPGRNALLQCRTVAG
ncbi:MAG: hypothetical protein ACLGHD_01250 [Actinomycetes bacterium]